MYDGQVVLVLSTESTVIGTGFVRTEAYWNSLPLFFFTESHCARSPYNMCEKGIYSQSFEYLQINHIFTEKQLHLLTACTDTMRRLSGLGPIPRVWQHGRSITSADFSSRYPITTALPIQCVEISVYNASCFKWLPGRYWGRPTVILITNAKFLGL